jgi:hypothetical protein
MISAPAATTSTAGAYSRYINHSLVNDLIRRCCLRLHYVREYRRNGRSRQGIYQMGSALDTR